MISQHDQNIPPFRAHVARALEEVAFPVLLLALALVVAPLLSARGMSDGVVMLGVASLAALGVFFAVVIAMSTRTAGLFFSTTFVSNRFSRKATVDWRLVSAPL